MNRYGRPTHGPWRPQGAPYYLASQGVRLGLSPLVTGHPRVKDNRQLARIAGITAQACAEYFDAPRLGEHRTFADWQVGRIRAMLDQCEPEVSKTHAIAAAAAEMVDEAHAAFGLEPPARSFSVLAIADAPAESVEVASLRAEVERLRAENESLAGRLAGPGPGPDPDPALADTSPHRHQPKSRPTAKD